MIKNWEQFNKTNEEFKFFDKFKKKEKEKSMINSSIVIETKPYATSDFGQSKYKVYVKKGKSYYDIGEIRKFGSSGEPVLYINPFKSYIGEVKPKSSTKEVSEKERDLICDELDEINSAISLRNRDLSHRQKLEKNYGIILPNRHDDEE